MALDVDASMDAAQDNREGISRLSIRRCRREAGFLIINARQIVVPSIRALLWPPSKFQIK